MGFSYRKSFKAGPIRVTASKSGLSYSTKVGSTRVTKRADGRVTTSTSLPGGVRYTTSSKKGAASSTPSSPGTPRAITPSEIRSLYEQTFTNAIRRLRTGEATGAALRGEIWNQGIGHPRILQAVTDAERHLAREALSAQRDVLAREAAQRLRDGETASAVGQWLKRERGAGFFARVDITSRAKRINRAAS